MNMKHTILMIGMVAAFAAAARTGESWKSADSLSAGKSKTVTLVPEKDLDDGSYWDDGVYYISIKCSRYQSYTVYTTGVIDDMGIDMSVDDITMYKDYGDKDAPYLPMFDGSLDSDGNLRYILYSDDWDEDCAKEGTYYIRITGDVGTSVSVTFSKGEIEEPIQYGTEENPSPLTVGSGSKSGVLIGGYYWYAARLTAGKKYTFWTGGGTEDSRLTLDVYGDGETDVADPDTREMSGLDEYNQGWIVMPAVTGMHYIVLDGFETGRFTLNYGEVSSRTPDKHPFAELATPAPQGGPVSSGAFTPGHRNDPNSGFYDQVIDERLFKVKLAKDVIYAFSATGDGSRKMTMELYDKSGTALLATTAANPVFAYAPSAAADYYIGVCEALQDDETDEPSGISATLTIRTAAKGDGLTDAWDPMDDTTGEANGLSPNPGSATDDVVASGSAHGPHTLGLTDWVDTYQIAARKGLSYRLKSSLGADAGDSADWTLKAVVYTLSGTTKKQVAVIDDLAEGGSFEAAANGTYFVDVSVLNGQGRNYGPYTLHSLACAADGAGLGTLRVEIGGATYSEGATWWLASDGTSGPKYPGGSSVLLPGGSYEVRFAAVKNWTTPANVVKEVSVRAVSVVDVKYSDTNDDSASDAVNGDGTPQGRKTTKVAPASKEASVSRSLWKDDLADWYKFDVKANGFYSFALQPSARLGDAEISIYRANATDLVAKGTDVSFLCRETKGTYYVCVSHAQPAPLDSQYVMTYSMKQVGAVGFAKTALAAKDTATTVALSVSRTNGKEGRVRVRYATVAGTAVPGTHYLPQNGYLEWKDGDASPKTITIGLLGDLRARWEADRTFEVELATVLPGAVESDEYIPMLGAATATVTIQEATKMTPGQVAFSAWGDADEDFANAAKPAMSCAAGETVRLRLSRTGGSDGLIAVSVTPTKGTALADTHFDAAVQTVVWDDGDDADKYVSVQTYEQEDFMAAKAFTVKIAADKTVSGYAPSKVGAAVTVTLGDSDVSRSLNDYIADEKADGVAVKAGKADTWYVDALGRIRSAPLAAGGSATLTYTLKDHGKLSFLPTVVGAAADSFTCKIDKETVNLEDGKSVTRYLGKGSHTVVFTVARDKKSSSGDAYLALEPKTDGKAGVWKPLPLPSRIAPLAAEVALGRADGFGAEQATFAWSDASDPEIVYLFSLDRDAKKLGTAAAKIWFGTADACLDEARSTVPVYCPTCVIGEPSDGMIAGATYSWRVDSAFIDGGAIRLVNTNAVWTVVSATSETGEPAPRPYMTGTDASGRKFDAADSVGEPIEVTLVQGLAANFALNGTNVASGATLTYALAKGSAALPAGLSIKNGAITGVPTKAATTTNVVQITQKATVDKKAVTTVGATATLVITVEPMNFAEGTFNGLAVSGDSRLAATADARIGSVTFSSTSGGKLTAKVIAGGATYSFAGTGWTESETLDNGLPALSARLEQVSKLTANKKTYSCTNVLEVLVSRAATNDWDGIETPLRGSLKLNVLSQDKMSVLTDLAYDVEAVRDFSKVKHVAAEASAFAGYYTVSLPALDASSGAPKGYGYLTATVSAAGAAKVAAVLADGTKVSLSSAGAYIPPAAGGAAGFRIPVYYGKSPVAFGGWLTLAAAPDGTPVASADSRLTWINGSAASTYGGVAGFRQSLEPTGGYYDTVLNLQTYYLDRAFKVKGLDLDALPSELLGANEAYVAYPGMSDEYLNVLGNTISADKQVKAVRTDDKKLIDWANTVNPANTTVKFTRATGVYTGSFELYAGNGASGRETKQVKIGSMATQGVLLLSRDSAAEALPFDSALMPGFYLAPVKLDRRTWNASLPFAIIPEEVENDWTEGLPE